LVIIISEGNRIEGKQFTAELDMNYLLLESDVQSRYQRSTVSPHKQSSTSESDMVYISAQRFTLEENKNTATYEGAVKLRQEEVTIEADKVVLVKQGTVQMVYAFGAPAYFQQKSKQEQDIDAQAMRFEYNSLDKKVKLFDKARLKQGQAIFEGAYIFYDTQTESVGAEAKEDTRVKMVLPSKAVTTEKQQPEKQITPNEGKKKP
jgi:lipopolysaccharide export system protein LptA